ncbi:Tetratricopeptide repeat protein 27-like protein [Diplonema papillatum]|nr:Tetratricopeptide repeat protein 27-like protein [Diplonema papillatum]
MTDQLFEKLMPPPVVGDCAGYAERLREQVAGVLEAHGDEAKDALLEVLAVLLQAFACENFTGRLTDADWASTARWASVKHFVDGSAAAASECLAALVVDGEVANKNVLHPCILVACNILAATGIAEERPLLGLWRARLYFTHQRVLENKAHQLFKKCVDAYTALLSLPPGGGAPSPTEVHLVLGLVHYYYLKPRESNEHLRKAYELSGMKADLTSMVGVRTEHQVFETAQLVVKARTGGRDPPAAPAEFSPVVCEGSNVLHRPRTLQQNIDAGTVKESSAVFLEKVEDPGDLAEEDTPLSELEQAVLMGLCVNVRNNNPLHGLSEQERLAYVERLIGEENMPWALRSQALLIRSRMEQARVRVRERGLMQLCELCDQFSNPVKDPTTSAQLETSALHRHKHFWTVLYPTSFGLKTELANVYADIGLDKSSLDIHESLGNWSKVIACCKRLGKKTKAEALIREMLEKSPEDAILWASLGDATRNPEYYYKSWELSKHLLTQPMRGLGELFLETEKYEEAVECFDKALTLNPVYGANWFSMGWAALKTKQWERASECYTRNVQLDLEDGLSWSNLATCYLQLNRLISAYHALLQAKKWGAGEWRILDNLFTVSVEIGEHRTAIQTLNKLLDTNGRNYKVDQSIVLLLVQKVLAVLDGKEEEVDIHDRADLLPEPAQEELDDEIFDITPFGADIDLLPGEEVAEREVNTAHQQAVEKAKERSLANLKQETHKLLGKATTLITTDAGLFRAYGDFLEGTGNDLEAFDQRLKELRCLAKRGWQVDKKTALQTIEAACRAAQCSAKVSEEALAARTVRTMAPKAQALMQVQPVLKLAEDGHGKSPEYAALQEAVAALS